MKAVGYTAEADEELTNALARSPDPTSFRQAVDEALDGIATGVITHAVIPRTSYRSCPLPGRPFSIVYNVTADTIQVIALAHHKRRSGYWKKRLCGS